MSLIQFKTLRITNGSNRSLLYCKKMELRFFPGRKCWEVKVCMTFDANQWVWYYISLIPLTVDNIEIFFPKLSKALSPSALWSFKACTCFYVTRFQRWRMPVFHFRPTLNFMWETDEECVMSRTQDCRSCGRDTARYLLVGRRRRETAGSLQSVWARWQWSGLCVSPHLAGSIAPTSAVMNSGGCGASYGGAACCVCGTSQPLVLFKCSVGHRVGAERFRSHVWTFCVTSCLSQLPVRRTWR